MNRVLGYGVFFGFVFGVGMMIGTVTFDTGSPGGMSPQMATMGASGVPAMSRRPIQAEGKPGTTVIIRIKQP